MEETTGRLMLAMARRAKARAGTCGHAIARWEALHSRRAEAALGIDRMALARIAVTPLPATAAQAEAIAMEHGCDPHLLRRMTWGGRT